MVELLRGRMAIARPVDSARRSAARSASRRGDDAERALLALEADGVVLRGSFTPGSHGWRRMVRPPAAGAHPPAHAEPAARRDRAGVAGRLHAVPVRLAARRAASIALTGPDGLRAVIEQLDGFELAAGAWERARPAGARAGLRPSMLDMLCFTGVVAWARLSAGPQPAGLARRRARSARRRSRCACASTSTRGARSRRPPMRRGGPTRRSARMRPASSTGCGSAARRSCPS